MPEKENISIIISGDYHIYGKFDKFILKNPNHEVFSPELVDIIKASDLSVFNLEDPISDDQSNKCLKYGPYGVGSEASLLAIEKAGFKLATFATNHTYDMKNQGIRSTRDCCRRHGIQVIGAGLNPQEAKEPYRAELNGLQIAILNYSRIEFNIANDRHGGANPLDAVSNAAEIQSEKKRSDYVFVVIHEGADVFSLPYPKLKEQMRFYADMGADAIVLHHSRVISGYEVYNGVPIFYGIGNLLHLVEDPREHRGILLRFAIGKIGLEYEILPVALDSENITVDLCIGEAKQTVLSHINELSGIIQDDEKLTKCWADHVAGSRTRYLMIVLNCNRYIFRILRRLRLLGVVDWYLTHRRRRLLEIKYMLTCQTHRSILEALIDSLCDEVE